jgi:type I restriction enzyme R subunit
VIEDEAKAVFKPLDKDAGVVRYRRRLPHWQQQGCSYFVTWRTADSLPQSKIAILTQERDRWLASHPKPWTDDTWREYSRLFTERVQRWLDAGYGPCRLSRPELRKIVEEALRHFDGKRYVLDWFVVMPNHVHALFLVLGGWNLARTLHSWKSFTGKAINKLLEREGTFWMDENFDHAIRSAAQLERFRDYIRANPSKAGLGPREASLGQGMGITIPSNDEPQV